MFTYQCMMMIHDTDEHVEDNNDDNDDNDDDNDNEDTDERYRSWINTWHFIMAIKILGLFRHATLRASFLRTDGPNDMTTKGVAVQILIYETILNEGISYQVCADPCGSSLRPSGRPSACMSCTRMNSMLVIKITIHGLLAIIIIIHVQLHVGISIMIRIQQRR